MTSLGSNVDSDVEQAKRAAAHEACELLEDGFVVGLGTGSTAAHAVKRIGELVEEGLRVEGIPTSVETMELARHLDVPLTSLDEVDRVDLTIDGADEVDPKKRLVKGMGGALLREKIVASVSEREVIIVDERKLVDQLGTTSPLPVEAVQFARGPVRRVLEERGYEPELRGDGEKDFLTDNGNIIFDIHLDGIPEPERLEAELNTVPGVVENGLFLNLATDVIVGSADGSTRTL